LTLGGAGLSARNLKYMRAFAEVRTDPEVVQQAVAQLPRGHNVRLLESVKDPTTSGRIWEVGGVLPAPLLLVESTRTFGLNRNRNEPDLLG
jgi:hypothetical protein